MISLALSRFAKARVWFEDAPDAPALDTVVMREVGYGRSGKSPLPHVAIEAYLPRGARIEYGLIGAYFTEESCNVVRIAVPCATGPYRLWREGLAAQVDEVRAGLPIEYANAVLDAASNEAEGQFPEGKLSFLDAAYTEVGSSRDLFQRLARTTIRLMLAKRHDDQWLTETLRSHIL
jgi:hypothetical protein